MKNIQILSIDWEFEDDGFYGTVTIKGDIKSESVARDKLKEYLSNTEYIKNHPEDLEKRYNAFKLSNDGFKLLYKVKQ